MYFDDRIWKVDADTEARNIVEKVVREMIEEANQIPDLKESKRAHDMAAQYLNQYKLRCALEAAERKMVIDFDAFDTHPHLLNVNNGTYDLKTMSFGAHHRMFYLTKCAPVRYDPEAKCPRWEQFLFEVMGGNENLIYFLQKAIGYALTDSTKERVFFILWGSGFNGKTTFLETILSLLGEYEYALTTPVETFMMTRTSGGIPNDIARLRGARFVYATEGEIGHRLAESRIKRLTGRDTLSARFLYGEWFDFKPTCKLFLGTNHKPTIRGTDEAIWDRVRLVPFTQCFRGQGKEDKNLGEKLQEELPGILNWALEGCEIWQQEGLGYPEEIREATKEYRSNMDILGDFLDDMCESDPFEEVRSSELYNAYKAWSENNGERVVSSSDFKESLEERGFMYKRTKNRRIYTGVRLKVDDG
jgi:putative DNA primase/helicase